MLALSNLKFSYGVQRPPIPGKRTQLNPVRQDVCVCVCAHVNVRTGVVYRGEPTVSFILTKGVLRSRDFLLMIIALPSGTVDSNSPFQISLLCSTRFVLDAPGCLSYLKNEKFLVPASFTLHYTHTHTTLFLLTLYLSLSLWCLVSYPCVPMLFQC